MKPKSAFILLIACIVLVCCIIIELIRPYHKTKNLEISQTRWILGIILVSYLSFCSGFGAYSYYTGLYRDLLNSLWIPLCILGIVGTLKAMFSKNLPSNITKGKLIYIFLISVFVLYISYDSFYKAIYLPYISPWFN